MSLANEASYLYVYSKKLIKLNKELKKLSKKAEKHRHKHGKAKTTKQQEKHKSKHSQTTDKIKDLTKKHNRILGRIKHHYLAFAHSLRKEHKI